MVHGTRAFAKPLVSDDAHAIEMINGSSMNDDIYNVYSEMKGKRNIYQLKWGGKGQVYKLNDFFL